LTDSLVHCQQLLQAECVRVAAVPPVARAQPMATPEENRSDKL
jgi:hypothetical protein